MGVITRIFENPQTVVFGRTLILQPLRKLKIIRHLEPLHRSGALHPLLVDSTSDFTSFMLQLFVLSSGALLTLSSWV